MFVELGAQFPIKIHQNRWTPLSATPGASPDLGAPVRAAAESAAEVPRIPCARTPCVSVSWAVYSKMYDSRRSGVFERATNLPVFPTNLCVPFFETCLKRSFKKENIMNVPTPDRRPPILLLWFKYIAKLSCS